MTYLWRVVSVGITAHMIALGAGVMAALMDHSPRWMYDAGLVYLLCVAWVVLADFLIHRAPDTAINEQPLPVEQLGPRFHNLTDRPDPRSQWQQITVTPPSMFPEWSSIADDETLRKMFAVLARTGTVSTRSMKGILNTRQLDHLKSYLHGRGLSDSWKGSASRKGAEVLNERGKASIATYTPSRK